MDYSDFSNLILVICLVLTVGGIVAGVFFLLSMQRVLKLCAPQNRTITPGQVWLCFIPLFGMVWVFVMVSRISSSLRLEFESRQTPREDYGRGVGLAYCILGAISIVPILGIFTGLASCVCWIVYWVKISGYSQELEDGGAALSQCGEPAAESSQESSEVEEAFNPGKAWPVLLILILAYGAQHLQSLTLSWFFPALKADFRIGYQSMGMVFTAFAIGLMAGYLLILLITALCGTRWGLVVALAGASLAAVGSGLATSLSGLILTRGFLGFFAGGLLPAAIQSLADAFPARLRPLAIGLFLASSPLFALVMSPMVPHITHAVGWRIAIMVTGIPTAIAAVLCWVVWPRSEKRSASGKISSLGIVAVVMLGVGLLLATPAYSFVQVFLPTLIRVSTVARYGTFALINLGALAGGALLAGVAAWGLMDAGVSPWKMRAALLTVLGLILTVALALGAFANEWVVMAASALAMAGYQGWSTILYAGVADTLPSPGVAIGAAIGAFISSGVLQLYPMLVGSLTNGYGMRVSLGVSACLAAAGLLCIGLLAWLVHPKAVPFPEASPAEF